MEQDDRSGRKVRRAAGLVALVAGAVFAILLTLHALRPWLASLQQTPPVEEQPRVRPRVEATSAPLEPQKPAVQAAAPAQGPEVLSDECLSLWSGLTAADILARSSLSLQEVRQLPASDDCTVQPRADSKSLRAALEIYRRLCDQALKNPEGPALDERDVAVSNALAACAQAARNLRAWLGYLSVANRPISEIDDPNAIVDSLLVISGDVNRPIGQGQRELRRRLAPPIQAKLVELTARLQEVAETPGQRELADRYENSAVEQTNYPPDASAPAPAPTPTPAATPSQAYLAAESQPTSASGDSGYQPPVINMQNQNPALTRQLLKQWQVIPGNKPNTRLNPPVSTINPGH